MKGKLTGTRLYVFTLGILALNGVLMTVADWGDFGLMFTFFFYCFAPEGGRRWWQVLVVWAMAMLVVFVAQPANVPIDGLYFLFSVLGAYVLVGAVIEGRRVLERKKRVP